MPVATRVSNKNKHPALVLIQAMSPKKTKRRATNARKKKGAEMPLDLEEGITRVSEIETRQAELHSDASNATPVGPTRATGGLRAGVTDNKVNRASKSRKKHLEVPVQGTTNDSLDKGKAFECYVLRAYLS
jgi:hypothetical protein